MRGLTPGAMNALFGLLGFLALSQSLWFTEGKKMFESSILAKSRKSLFTHASHRVPKMTMGYPISEEDLPLLVDRGNLSSSSPTEPTIKSRRRRATGAQPAVNETLIANDFNPRLQMLWTGSGSNKGNSSIIIIRTYHPGNPPSSPPKLYISYNYAQSFTELKLKLQGAVPVISHVEISSADPTRYIFVDQTHHIVFTSKDGCLTFQQHIYAFPMQYISPHSSNPDIVIALDTLHRMWISRDWAATWNLLQTDVLLFHWGKLGVGQDTADTLYVERTQAFQDIIYSHDFFATPAVTFMSNAWDTLFHGSYIFALTSRGSETVLVVSKDRGQFQETHFGNYSSGKRRIFKEYFVVDSSKYQAFVVAYDDRSGKSALYVSDETGTDYSISLENFAYSKRSSSNKTSLGTNSQSFMAVEWYNAGGVGDTVIAAQTVGGHVYSVVSYNAGGEWEDMKVLLTDASGKDFTCGDSTGCSLHFSRRKVPPSYISHKTAPGIMMAQGRGFGSGYNSSSAVFTSMDAGYSWTKALDGEYWFDMGDHGGIQVALGWHSGSASSMLYSVNYGKSWQTFKFHTSPVRVFGILSEPGYHTTVFNIIAEDGANNILIISIDFAPLLGRNCVAADYKEWYPFNHIVSPIFAEPGCVLGRREHFQRRLQDTICLSGVHHSTVHFTHTCECSRDDYECAPGFEDRVDDFACLPSSTGLAYVQELRDSLVCRNDQITLPSGYRRIPGDTCRVGTSRYEPQVFQCGTFTIRLHHSRDGSVFEPVGKSLAATVGELLLFTVELLQNDTQLLEGRTMLLANGTQLFRNGIMAPVTSSIWRFGDSTGDDQRFDGLLASHRYSRAGVYHMTVAVVFNTSVAYTSLKVTVAGTLPTNFSVSIRTHSPTHTGHNSLQMLAVAEFANSSASLDDVVYNWNISGRAQQTSSPFLYFFPSNHSELFIVELYLTNGIHQSSHVARATYEYTMNSTIEGVRLSDIGVPNTVLVRWQMPTMGKPDKVIVKAESVDNSEVKSILLAGNAAQCLLTGLHVGLFSIKVLAVFENILIMSDSLLYRIRPPIAAVGIPRNLFVTRLLTGGDFLQWDPVPNAYKYQVASISRNRLVLEVMVNAWDCSRTHCSYSLQHTDTTGFYFYRVRALDSDSGAGEFSYIASSRINISGTPPVISPTHLQLTSYHENGIVRGRLSWYYNEFYTSFRVRVRGPDDRTNTWSTYSSHNTSLALASLSEGSRYRFQVAALVNNVAGPYAEFAAFYRVDNPRVAQNISVTKLGSGSVNVSWLPPRYTNFWITHYVLELAGPFFSESHNSEQVPVVYRKSSSCTVQAEAAQLHCLLHHLESLAVYWVRVSVFYDEFGSAKGNPSTEHRFILPPYGPVVTSDITIRPNNTDNSRASMLTIAEIAKNVVIAEVSYSLYGRDTRERTFTLTSSEPRAEILLWPSTRYDFYVSIGSGDPEKINYRTPPAEVGSQMVVFDVSAHNNASVTQAEVQSLVFLKTRTSIPLSTLRRFIIGMAIVGFGTPTLRLHLLLAANTPKQDRQAIRQAERTLGTIVSEGPASEFYTLQQYNKREEDFKKYGPISHNHGTTLNTNEAFIIVLSLACATLLVTLVFMIHKTMALHSRNFSQANRSIIRTAASTARQPNRHVHFQDNISTGSLNSQADLAASESDRLQDNTASGQANISEEAKSEQLFSVSYSNDAAGEEDLTEDC